MIALGVLGFLGMLIAVLVLRTLFYRSKQTGSDPEAMYEIDVDNPGKLDRLSEALRIQTISSPNAASADKEPFLRFHNFLRQSFPLVHRTLECQVLNELSLIFSWKGTDQALEPLLFLAHMDVVPVDPKDYDSWSHAPFAGTVADGYIWGRGTMDLKGSLVAQLEAVEALLKKGFCPKHTIYFAFGHDEESGGNHGAVAIAGYFASQGIRFEYALDEGLMITKGIVQDISGPIALIGIAEKGYCSFRVSARYDGGHSSMPERKTAVSILGTAITRISKIKMPSRMRGPARYFFDYLGPHMPGAKKLMFANMWLAQPLLRAVLSSKNTTNALIRTTVVPTMLEGSVQENVVPNTASCTVNCRIIPGETIEDIASVIRHAVKDPAVTVETLTSIAFDPSPVSSPFTDGFRNMQKILASMYSDTLVVPSLALAGSDSRHYVKLAKDIYRFTPLIIVDEDRKRIHGIDERISVDNYFEMIGFYASLFSIS